MVFQHPDGLIRREANHSRPAHALVSLHTAGFYLRITCTTCAAAFQSWARKLFASPGQLSYPTARKPDDVPEMMYGQHLWYLLNSTPQIREFIDVWFTLTTFPKEWDVNSPTPFNSGGMFAKPRSILLPSPTQNVLWWSVSIQVFTFRDVSFLTHDDCLQLAFTDVQDCYCGNFVVICGRKSMNVGWPNRRISINYISVIYHHHGRNLPTSKCKMN